MARNIKPPAIQVGSFNWATHWRGNGRSTASQIGWRKLATAKLAARNAKNFSRRQLS
jgi:hypothetical protein